MQLILISVLFIAAKANAGSNLTSLDKVHLPIFNAIFSLFQDRNPFQLNKDDGYDCDLYHAGLGLHVGIKNHAGGRTNCYDGCNVTITVDNIVQKFVTHIEIGAGKSFGFNATLNDVDEIIGKFDNTDKFYSLNLLGSRSGSDKFLVKGFLYKDFSYEDVLVKYGNDILYKKLVRGIRTEKKVNDELVNQFQHSGTIFIKGCGEGTLNGTATASRGKVISTLQLQFAEKPPYVAEFQYNHTGSGYLVENPINNGTESKYSKQGTYLSFRVEQPYYEILNKEKIMVNNTLNIAVYHQGVHIIPERADISVTLNDNHLFSATTVNTETSPYQLKIKLPFGYGYTFDLIAITANGHCRGHLTVTSNDKEIMGSDFFFDDQGVSLKTFILPNGQRRRTDITWKNKSLAANSLKIIDKTKMTRMDARVIWDLADKDFNIVFSGTKSRLPTGVCSNPKFVANRYFNNDTHYFVKQPLLS